MSAIPVFVILLSATLLGAAVAPPKSTPKKPTTKATKAANGTKVDPSRALSLALPGERPTPPELRTLVVNLFSRPLPQMPLVGGLGDAKMEASILTAKQAQVLARVGALNEARQLYERAITEEQGARRPGRNSDAVTIMGNTRRRQHFLSQLGIAQAYAGDIEGARKIAFRSLESGTLEDPQDHWKSPLLIAIVESQCRIGDLKGAKKTVNTMNLGLQKFTAWSILSAAQAKAGDFTGASESSNQIGREGARIFGAQPPRPMVDTLALIALEQARHKKLASARSTLKTALSMMKNPAFKYQMETYPDQTIFPDPVLRVVLVQDALGDPAGARQTCLEAHPLDQKWPGGIYIRTSVFSRLAEAQAARGDREAARKTLALARTGMAEPLEFEYEWQVRCLSRIARALNAAGDKDGAQKTLEEARRSLEESERNRRTRSALLSSTFKFDFAVAEAELGNRAAADALIQQTVLKNSNSRTVREDALRAQIRLGDWVGAQRTANAYVLDEVGADRIKTAWIAVGALEP